MIANHFVSVPTNKDVVSLYPHRASKIVIGTNAWVGARAVLIDGARIGKGAIIGAAAVVDFEVPLYTVAVGNPARILRPNRSKS